MIKIAITGGIGSGKSTALSLLKGLGFAGFSCDEIYGELQKEPCYISEVAKLFPPAVKGDVLDKKALSSIVFNDKKALERLNRISHPLIMERLFERMKEANTHLVFAEVPLLFEGGFEKDFDYVFVIVRNLEKRIESIKTRDGLNKIEIEDRIKNQFNYDGIEEDGKIKIIHNDGDERLLASLKEVVSKIPMPL